MIRNFLKVLSSLVVLAMFSTKAMALVWGQDKWGESKWGANIVQETLVRPEASVPVAPKVRSLTGVSSDAVIAAGAFREGGTPTYGNSFTAGDVVAIVADIKPVAADVGKNGQLIVVLLSITSAGQQFSFLNEDGNFVPWDLKLATLGPAQIKTPLEETNSITIFQGSLQAGRHRMAVGYQVGSQLIYTAKALNIVVSN